MPLNQPPTAAAMRAAKRINESEYPSLSDNQIAAIIDQETNVAGLVEALTLLLAGAEYVQSRGVINAQINGGVVLARAALQKARTT